MGRRGDKPGAQERVVDSSVHSNASLVVRENSAPLTGQENIRSRPHQSQAAKSNPQNAEATPRTFASVAATIIYDAINAANAPNHLDRLAREMWRDYSEGAISDDDATFLGSFIDRRRPPGRGSASGHAKQLGGHSARLLGRLGSRFKSRQHPRSPDRKASRDRRRMLGGSGVMPANLRHHYTEGQRAVLCIVSGEVKHHGICDLPIDKIAALAGVCRTTVQTTLHEARRLFHLRITERPQPGRKSLTNMVEIISQEWVEWLKRGPMPHRPIGSNSVKMASPTKKTEIHDDLGLVAAVTLTAPPTSEFDQNESAVNRCESPIA